jgi:flagellar motor component MotA
MTVLVTTGATGVVAILVATGVMCLMQVLMTTGALAREWKRSRERVLQVLKELGLEPMRDSNGRRLLDEKTVERLRRYREKQVKRVNSGCDLAG